MLALAVPPVFGNPRGMISRPNILSSEEGNHDALIALRSSFMSSTFSSSSSSSSSSFQVQSIISSKNISDEVISGTSSPIEQLKNASAKKPTYLLNRPKFDALFPKISNTKAVPIPLSSSIMTEQTKFSTYNDGSNNDDDDVSYHGPEKNNKTTKDRLITLDLNPYSHGSTSYIDDKNITRLKSQNPLLPGVEDEEYIRYKKTVSDWTLALNRSLRQSVKITYDAVVEAEYELIRFESTSGTELTSVSAPGAVSNDIKLLTIDIDSVGVTKPAAAEVATSLDVEEVIDMIDNEPSVALITIKEESIHPSPAPSPEPIVESVTIDSDSNSDKSPKPNPYHENVSSIPVPNSDQIPQSDLVGVTNATPIVSVDTGMQVDDKSATTPQDIKVAEDPFNASSISQHLLCAPCMPSTLRKKLRAPQTDANFAYPALYNGLSSTLRQDPNISALLAVESALRKCVFCHDGTVGDIVYGRIMTSLDGHFFHVNCLRFSHGVIENSNGVLEGSLAVLER